MSYKHLLGLPIKHKMAEIEGLLAELQTLMKLDGSRVMTGILDMGGFNVIGTGSLFPFDTGRSLGGSGKYWSDVHFGRLMMYEDRTIWFDESEGHGFLFNMENERFEFYISDVCVGYVDVNGFHSGAPP